MPEEERGVSIAEAKEMLGAEAEMRDISISQRFAREHADVFARLSAEEAKNLQAELAEMNFIPENIQIKVVDFLPKYPEEVRALFSKERMVLEKTHIDQILSAVAKYR